MSQVCANASIRQESGSTAARSAAGWLHLAAAPTFAIMALLTGVMDAGHLSSLCSITQDTSPLTGMVTMYLLMSVFHSVPWLKLITGRRGGARRHRVA